MNDYFVQPPYRQQPAFKPFPIGKKDLLLALFVLIFGCFLWNSFCYGGLNLGVAIGGVCCLSCAFVYLLCCGYRPGGYSASLLILSLVSLVGFARSDDSFVKFVLLCFILVGSNLGLCLMAKKQLWSADTVHSLLDAPRTIIMFGMACAPEAVCGVGQTLRSGGTFTKKGGAILLGLGISVPILAIMIPLLISADAAFDGLMQLLPDLKAGPLLNTLIIGTVFSCLLFTRSVALHHKETTPRPQRTPKGANALTVNTVLSVVCLLYGVYLVSQLAYLSGGFAGILPEEFTMAQYARRGFFEMALLSLCNLTVMILSLGFVQKESRSPLVTRLLCLFLGIITLFLIATASAKMFLYIDSFGLSRLRLLTQIIMLFLAVTAAVIMCWLFLPKLPYMKAILLAAMVIGAVTLWADVDTIVASHNVNGYLSGKYTTIDVS